MGKIISPPHSSMNENVISILAQFSVPINFEETIEMLSVSLLSLTIFEIILLSVQYRREFSGSTNLGGES